MIDFPWNDRAGRFSTVRGAAFALALAPACWLAFEAATGGLGAKPLTEATHQTGLWTIRLLLVTLALTPLRRITGWNRCIVARRLLGLSVFAYAVGHLALYVADQGWDLGQAASEIALRFYLTVGFVALVGLALLAATSTDAAIRRLGRRWQQLHRTVYALAALGVLHFFLQSKIDASEATLMMGFWLLLMGWRAAQRAGAPLGAPRTLTVVALAAGLATAGLEALWYGLATGIPWRLVLAANLTLTPWPRPAWWVLGAGLAAALLPLARARLGRRPLSVSPSRA
ncbi:sulfoxide reductase heme-binding subunit YedZ [Tistlia consotensis]|uniref:Protein-methionine-sulfoxide reductase heme-binding subunit MsrQ n=1 Tax=Tistlia consotensis USBA 355 TaxID=560819 RepID=A0A1Y6BM73_9PROT|nr:protein-methionine-sulfoxide reductase heme-binding subunit MsrQ [Tistlia consotensis]SMF18317.1 sulfoxide reductase heme-binding subunit YedZ [Tistlia consotensis USBA 355]SNR39730.1 sulfoxide reductase heme-binding subunit YedZ [Tistlia consotensis]